MATLGFDVYGTLIDPAGIAVALERWVGARAAEFARVWREKQLEYVFRRGLMQASGDFALCTRHALDYCCLRFGAELSGEDREALIETYRELPAYADAASGLAALSATSARLYTFSMGDPDDLEALLSRNGLDGYFDGFMSLAGTGTFKPSPDAYARFCSHTDTAKGDAWLVSGNPFDVIGAVAAGINGAWVRRSPDAVWDPWGIAPTVTVDTVGALASAVEPPGTGA